MRYLITTSLLICLILIYIKKIQVLWDNGIITTVLNKFLLIYNDILTCVIGRYGVKC